MTTYIKVTDGSWKPQPFDGKCHNTNDAGTTVTGYPQHSAKHYTNKFWS